MTDIDHALLAISALNLVRIEKRVAKDHPHWPEERVADAVVEYRRFLALALLYPEVSLIPPTQEVDEVWHAHILHTVQYEEDCIAVLGEFFHHQPGEGKMPIDLYEETLNLYRSVFGSDPKGTLWPENA